MGTAPLDRFTAVAGPGRRVGAGLIFRCPVHEDRRPSLGVKEAADGRLLVRCYAGCETADVLAALGLSWRDLFAD
jgi:hypothetical protein